MTTPAYPSPGKSFVATLRVLPDRRDQFIALQTELKRLVFQQEPDALVYEVMQDEADENLFLVIATFRDEAAFDHHMHIDFHERLVPPIMECLAADMEIAYFRSLQ